VAVFVGTSGWQYKDWRRRYYAKGVNQNRWFEHIMRDFRTVELNVTFYRLPRVEVFAGWFTRSPDDAIITVKASRYLTHVKRLRDPQPSVAMLMDRIAPLGHKLGPVLIQLPPDLAVAVEALDTTLAAFPAGVRLAVEPRHESWWIDDVRRLLERHNAALCWADRKGGAITPLWRTADWGYVRFHEGSADPWPFYTDDELRSWAGTIATTFPDDCDVYAYFNNDPGAAAIDNAITFADSLRACGRSVSRVPATRPDLTIE